MGGMSRAGDESNYNEENRYNRRINAAVKFIL